MAHESTTTAGTPNMAWMMGANFLTGMIGGLDAASSYKHQLKIQKIQADLNQHFADIAYKENMQSIYDAQNAMQEQVVQENLAEQKEYRLRQSQLRIFQAETGQEGQSGLDTYNVLAKSHLDWKQIQMGNILKAERALASNKMSIGLSKIAGDASRKVFAIHPKSSLFALAGGISGLTSGLAMYYQFMNWTSVELSGGEGGH